MKDSTTLLRSQCEALRNLPPESFKAAVTAIWDYEMDNIEPADPIAAMAVGMARPLIDKRNKRAESGRIGGSKTKQTEANGKQIEATVKQTEAKEERRNIKDKSKNIKDIKDRHFVPPTLTEVQEYISEKGYKVDAERFIDFYTSKGWMVGKNKMKDWKATVRNWERSQRQESTVKDRTVGRSGFNNFSSSGEDWDDMAYQIMDKGII